MSLLYLSLASVALLWLLLLIYAWTKKNNSLLSQDDAFVNLKVNLGRVAGVHSIQGERSHMEDAYYGDHEKGFFAVYDGHGGNRVSKYLATHLHEIVLKHFHSDLSPENALREGFKEVDKHWLQLAELNNWDDGSTAVACLVVNKTLYVANVGDSRCVLSSNGRAVEMSVDHKPNRQDERERVEKLGGRVIHYGTWRVQGVLAVSRAIGDKRLKQYVTSEPEIKVHELKEGDDFLILASDGVWDVLKNQAAVDIVTKALRDFADNPSFQNNNTTYTATQHAARSLTDCAHAFHSMDNITTMVIDLRQFR